MPAAARANVDLAGLERRQLDLKGKSLQVEAAVISVG